MSIAERNSYFKNIRTFYRPQTFEQFFQPFSLYGV